MKREIAQAIVDALEGSEKEPTLYEDYSGRCMYGDTTTGLVVHSMSSVVIGWAQACRDDDELDPYELENIRTDNLGLDTIVY